MARPTLARKDCGDYFAGLEERSSFRRPTSETTSVKKREHRVRARQMEVAAVIESTVTELVIDPFILIGRLSRRVCPLENSS